MPRPTMEQSEKITQRVATEELQAAPRSDDGVVDVERVIDAVVERTGVKRESATAAVCDVCGIEVDLANTAFGI